MTTQKFYKPFTLLGNGQRTVKFQKEFVTIVLIGRFRLTLSYSLSRFGFSTFTVVHDNVRRADTTINAEVQDYNIPWSDFVLICVL